MNQLALVCAAFLLRYPGPLPEYVWHDDKPAAKECNAALGKNALPSKWDCYAVTYWIGDTYGLVIGEHSQPFRVWVIEGIRLINDKRGLRIPATEVYRLADRYGECSEAPRL